MSAPTLDTTNNKNSGHTTAQNPLLVTLATMSAVTNGVAICMCSTVNSDPANISGVTFNGSAMTASQAVGASGNRVYCFYKAIGADSGGSRDFAITGANGANFLEAFCMVWDNAHQTTPIGNTATTQSNQTSPVSDSITIASGNYAISMFVDRITDAISAGGGQTLVDTNIAIESSLGIACCSYKQNATAMSWSGWAGSTGITTNVIELVGFAGGGGINSRFIRRGMTGGMLTLSGGLNG